MSVTRKKASARKSKRAARLLKMNRIILLSGLAVSLVMTGFLALSSVSTAVFAFGFTGLSFLFLFEKSRRTDWEKAIEHNLKTLEAAHDFVARKVRRNTADIKNIKTVKPAPSPRPDTKPVQQKKGPPPVQKKPKKFASLVQDTPLLGIMPANDEKPSYYTSLSDTVVTELLSQAVSKQEMTVLAQPMIRLPERTVRGYELFSRIRSRPGHYVPAMRYMGLARAGNMLPAVDTQMLIQSLQWVRQANTGRRHTLFFLNISLKTITHKPFIDALLGFIARDRALASCLVFEFSQQEFAQRSPAAEKVLAALGQLGCTVSLDNIKTLDFDMRALRELRVRFIKVEAAFLLKKSNTESKAGMLRSIKRRLERAGVGMIAEKAGTPGIIDRLAFLDLHYIQGYACGRPGIPNASMNAAPVYAETFRRAAAGQRHG